MSANETGIPHYTAWDQRGRELRTLAAKLAGLPDKRRTTPIGIYADAIKAFDARVAAVMPYRHQAWWHEVGTNLRDYDEESYVDAFDAVGLILAGGDAGSILAGFAERVRFRPTTDWIRVKHSSAMMGRRITYKDRATLGDGYLIRTDERGDYAIWRAEVEEEERRAKASDERARERLARESPLERMEAWTRAGRQLANLDPALFGELLGLAEKSVDIYIDPIGSTPTSTQDPHARFTVLRGGKDAAPLAN